MKPFRPGQEKKLSFRNDPLAKYANNAGGITLLLDLTEKELIRIAARRVEELRSRGYPEEWIKKDLEKLMEGVV